ncbi:hypothetical protein Tco_1501939 [Tanacetum coccineum]
MKRAGKDFSGRITPLFDTMMVQPVEEIGEDSDNPTDSTPIPIIDQPSSSSQPKKDKLSKKVQRQEAEVPQDEAEHEESLPTPSSDPQPSAKDAPPPPELKEIDALKKRIQRLERRKISRPTGLKRLRKVSMSRRVKSSADQESLGVPEDASKQGRSIEDIDDDVDVSLTPSKVEREELTDEEKAKLFMELMEKEERKMELENSQNNALAKLPMLKLGEKWEFLGVPIPVTTPESGPSTALKMIVPSTTEEKICKKNNVKARIPSPHMHSK